MVASRFDIIRVGLQVKVFPDEPELGGEVHCRHSEVGADSAFHIEDGEPLARPRSSGAGKYKSTRYANRTGAVKTS